MIQVGAAIIEDAQGRVLIARRKEGKAQAGLWEFPGGKVEEGESVPDCLVRELHEEMHIEIEPKEHFGVNDHQYGDKHIRLIAYKALYKGGEITLVDHDDYKWASREELKAYPFAPADIPFVERLERA